MSGSSRPSGSRGLSSVGDAYARRADEYIALLGTMDSVHPDDRELVGQWSRGIAGRVVDAGCGPGQWTHFLQGRGAQIEGIDLVPEFVASARESFPGVAFRVARLESLGVADGSLAGILAWYSTVHTPPARMREVLAEFARCLAPGGSLLLGFFAGPGFSEGSDSLEVPGVEAFDHAVVTAYRWPFAALSAQLLAAGFEVVETHARADAGARPHGAVVARRSG